jgi:hypothetical protein
VANENPTKAKGGAAYFKENGTAPVSGVNPYAVVSEFDSASGSAGGRPGVNLKIKGSDHG